MLEKKKLTRTKKGKYLIKLFQLEKATNREEILREIITRLRLIAEKGEVFLQKIADYRFDNIWIVSSSLVRKKGTKEYHSVYKQIPDAEIQRLDPECRMIIYADAFHIDPAVYPDIETKPVGREVILHEMTHILEDSEDWIRYHSVDKGFSKSAEDALMDYRMIYKSKTLLESKHFKDFASHVAKSLNKPTISKEAVARAIMKFPMLRANFQMMDAEMIMIMLRDFADGREFNQRPIVKRSVNVNKTGTWEMFISLALGYILGGGIFERNLQLNKTQEQTTTITTANVSVNPTNKEVTETVEIAKDTVDRSSLNLVTETEIVTSVTSSVSDQPVDREFLKTTAKPGLLDLVVTSIERSVKENSNATQISRNQKDLSLQY
ncbi:hypothetical protein E1H99_05285 [Enterococcus hirae]|nr:hypothetical protein E1H99_05285 [Enterococcus hirae]